MQVSLLLVILVVCNHFVIVLHIWHVSSSCYCGVHVQYMIIIIIVVIVIIKVIIISFLFYMSRVFPVVLLVLMSAMSIWVNPFLWSTGTWLLCVCVYIYIISISDSLSLSVSLFLSLMFLCEPSLFFFSLPPSLSPSHHILHSFIPLLPITVFVYIQLTRNALVDDNLTSPPSPLFPPIPVIIIASWFSVPPHILILLLGIV